MAILNYTTSIASEKSIGEIQKCLVAHGAHKIVTDYSNGIPVSVTFALSIKDRMIAFSLPANHAGVLKAMERDKRVPRSRCNSEQAQRVAWRIVKDWIVAQMALIDAQVAEMAEIFLPYAITQNGNTLYRELQDGGMKMIGQPLR